MKNDLFDAFAESKLLYPNSKEIVVPLLSYTIFYADGTTETISDKNKVQEYILGIETKRNKLHS